MTIQEDITKVYIGYFGRAPEPGGFNYWIGQFQDGGDGPGGVASLSLATIAASFSVQPESKALYPYLAGTSTDASAFVSRVYQNLFNRAPDAEGLAYWVGELANAAGNPEAIGAMVINIISGAVTNPDKAIIDNKVSVGLDWQSSIAALTDFTYDTAAGNSAKGVLDGVTDSAESVVTAKAETSSFVNVFNNFEINGKLTNITAKGNANSLVADISDDGSSIGFLSLSNSLASGNKDGDADVLLYDVVKGLFNNITSGDARSDDPSLSANGKIVAFESLASNLTQDSTSGKSHIFAYNIDTEMTVNITTGANFGSFYPAVSGDGSAIVFQSAASNLTTGDTNDSIDVFLYNVVSKSLTNITAGGLQGGGGIPEISADGKTVVLSSSSGNLTGEANTQTANILIYNVDTQQFTNITTGANNGSSGASISADGSTIVFQSYASNLTTGDTNGQHDIFLYDVASGQTTNITGAGNGGSANAHISADGSRIVFESYASNLTTGDTNGATDVFLYDVAHKLFVNIGSGNDAAISGDGSRVTFASYSDNLTANDDNRVWDVFMYEVI